jgi:hypothetical protein
MKIEREKVWSKEKVNFPLRQQTHKQCFLSPCDWGHSCENMEISSFEWDGLKKYKRQVSLIIRGRYVRQTLDRKLRNLE